MTVIYNIFSIDIVISEIFLECAHDILKNNIS